MWARDCFSGHSVLVVGGTSGIGLAIAQAFATHGADVTVAGATADHVPTLPGRSKAVVLDVRDAAAVADLVGSMDRIDHLIYAAGIIRRGAEHDPEVFADVLDVNLTGAMRAVTAARPLLAERKGTIVLMASMLSFFGGGLVPGYAASKGGIAQLTKSLAIAYAADGIRVNAIAPGWIATGLTNAIQADPLRSRAIVERTPLARWGTPEDVAGVALFLASPLAAFVTGCILPVDGGYLVS